MGFAKEAKLFYFKHNKTLFRKQKKCFTRGHKLLISKKIKTASGPETHPGIPISQKELPASSRIKQATSSPASHLVSQTKFHLGNSVPFYCTVCRQYN